MNDRLVHDVAWSTALVLTDIISRCLRDDEKRDAFHEFYGAVRAGLEAYEIQARRLQERLRPGRN